MLHTGVESAVRPEAVRMERIENEKTVVRLTDHVAEEDRDGQIIFVYDEVLFDLEPGRAETEADILEEFEDWWTFGTQLEEPLPTIEERLELVEMLLMGGMA